MSNVSVFVFMSGSCEPCRVVKPVLFELKEDYPLYNWKFVDINNDPEKYGKYYNVSNIPSMTVVKDEKIFGSHKGTAAMGYLSLLKRAKQ
jgi:thiol-disulfide isomerase/thioredoxin